MSRAIQGSALICCLSLCLVPAQTPIRKAWTPMPDAKLASIPVFALPAAYKDRTAHPLPAAIDNSKQQWFTPYGWNQQGNSCANAQAVSYVYGYETMLTRNKPVPTGASTPEYTYEYTYHFLNGGDQSDGGDGWNFVEAFDIMKETG